MSRSTALLLAALSLSTATQAGACAPPPPQCEVAGGQIATLEEVKGRNVHFSQYDPDAPVYAPTHVLVTCHNRLAVAFGPVPDSQYDNYIDGRRAISDALYDSPHPSLRQVHHRLRKLDLPSRRFKLRADHCGCDLPDIPPPRANCPDY